MDVIYQWPIWVVALAVLVLMFAANEIGYRVGSARRQQEPERSQTVGNMLKASIIGLVALVLGFSYAMTSGRYDQRLRLVLDEANAIGTCYLRAGLLADQACDAIRAALRRYTDLRLEHFELALDRAEFERTTQGMDAAMRDLWSGVEFAVASGGQQALVAQIVPAANAVIDLSATRAWASRNQMPATVVLLLAICMTASSALMGHSSGQVGRRHVGLWSALNVLVLLVLIVVLDFDRPRRGLIQLNHAPLLELRRSMGP